MVRRRRRILALAGMLAAAWVGVGLVVGGASAQEATVRRGLAIAQTWCVNCHAISDTNQASALADAPPFRALAARPDLSVAFLRQALLLPHPVMPEFPLTNADVEALAAYIGSLKGSEKAAPAEQRTGLGTKTTVASDESRSGTDGAIVLAAAPEAQADAARGEAIVSANCSPCHLIAGQGESPVADAPAFSTLSERYPVEYLAEALAEGIMVGHETVEMPTFVFEPDDVAAIIAYLNTVQE